MTKKLHNCACQNLKEIFVFIGTASNIRRPTEKYLQETKTRIEIYLDLISGDIHKQLDMKNRMLDVSRILCKKSSQEI